MTDTQFNQELDVSIRQKYDPIIKDHSEIHYFRKDFVFFNTGLDDKHDASLFKLAAKEKIDELIND